MRQPQNKKTTHTTTIGRKLFQRLGETGSGQLALLIVLLALLALTAVLTLNRQQVFDWLKLRGYTAPAPIAQLATQDTMTDSARRIFYVNAPILNSKASFADNCPSGGGE